MVGDGVEPGAEFASLAIAWQRCQRLLEDLLRRIFGPFSAAQLAVAVAVDAGEVAGVDCGEGAAVGLRLGGQQGVLDRRCRWRGLFGWPQSLE
jgi:hypothetical protein